MAAVKQVSKQPLFKSSKLLSAWINPTYLKPATITKLKASFQKAKPYRYLEADEFFNHDKMVAVLKALLAEKFYFKESDLFKFNQTQDLKNTKNKVLKEYVDFLYSKDFVNYMQELTGFSYSQTVDIAGTMYEDTNFLLCHDDKLDDRKIAFLCYMSTVSKSDGGSLALYTYKKTKAKNGKELILPNKIVKQIFPSFNKLAFFEVSEISFHEVEEVVTPGMKRLAIGGWYYGKK